MFPRPYVDLEISFELCCGIVIVGREAFVGKLPAFAQIQLFPNCETTPAVPFGIY